MANTSRTFMNPLPFTCSLVPPVIFSCLLPGFLSAPQQVSCLLLLFTHVAGALWQAPRRSISHSTTLSVVSGPGAALPTGVSGPK